MKERMIVCFIIFCTVRHLLVLQTNRYLTLLQDSEDSESAKNRHPEATRQRNDPETPTWPRWYQRVHTATVAATTPSVA